MRKLKIVGWREGLLKVSMANVLREHLSLTLRDAKATVDAVVDGETVSFTLGDGIDAGALREELERIGAIVELEDGGKPVRAPSRNET